MFDIPQPASALHTFAHDYNQSIQHAAFLLGGRSWLLRAQRLLDDLSQQRPLQARDIREASALQSLFALDNVHLLDSVEAACFADLDLDSSYVADICLLTEALEEALIDLAAVAVPLEWPEKECRV